MLFIFLAAKGFVGEGEHHQPRRLPLVVVGHTDNWNSVTQRTVIWREPLGDRLRLIFPLPKAAWPLTGPRNEWETFKSVRRSIQLVQDIQSNQCLRHIDFNVDLC